jgi:hypothetical protein
MGTVHPHRCGGRRDGSLGSIDHRESGFGRLGIRRRCLAAQIAVGPLEAELGGAAAMPPGGTHQRRSAVDPRAGTESRRWGRSLGRRYTTRSQAACPAPRGRTPSGVTPLPAVAWANLTLSPDVMHKRDRRNPEPGQPGRRLPRRFVVLPRHPLYGREVVVLSRRPEANVTVTCIVVLPENPTFRYRLPERWLESMPPSTSVPSALRPVRLPLAALDALTQRLLGFQRAECAYGQTDFIDACPSSDLESTSVASPAASDRAVDLSAAPHGCGTGQ